MSRSRTSLLTGVRDLVPLVPAGVAFGLVVGAAIGQVGLGLAESVGMSAGVYGASAKLAATLLWGEAAPLVVIVVTALVINARFFIYSASIAPHLRSRHWVIDVALGYLVRDGAYALTMTKAVPDPEIDETAHFFAGAAGADWVVWLVATSLGALGGALLPEAWSLDFIVPLVFVALLAGGIKGRADVEAAVVSVAAAIALVPLMPMQTGLLTAILAGMAWGFVRDGRSDTPAKSVESAGEEPASEEGRS